MIEVTVVAAVVDVRLAFMVVFLARRTDLLELDVRRRIYELVVAFPGLHLREVARQLDLDPNHVKYHLQYMEKHGLVGSRREGGYWRFWPRREGETGHQDMVDRRDKDVLSFLRRPVPLHVILILMDRETMSQVGICDEVDVSASTLHYHLTKMERAGIVVSQRQSRERLYRLQDPERLMALLLRYRPPDSLVRGFLEAWEQLELD